MKRTFLILFSIVLLWTGCQSDDAKEEVTPPKEVQVTLFDENKEAIAYIDYEDETTIYMFEGEPVAYIDSEEHVYGFNGKFLGWYREGVLYDHTCCAVGAKQGVAKGGINTVVTRVEKIKGVKQVKPVKHIGELASVRPLLKDSWSETSLTDFLAGGKK